MAPESSNQDSKSTPIVTLQTAARYLGIHEMTAYRLANQKKIPAFKVGGQWRVDMKKLDEHINRSMDIPPTY